MKTDTITTTSVHYELDGNIAHLVLDDPAQRVNTMNQAFMSSLTDAIDRLIADADQYRGVIISSKKKTFFAGGDLELMTKVTLPDAPTWFDNCETIKANLRKLETLAKPVVAAINGAALGGGLEIALAANHRIAVEGEYKIGLPEVTLGLLPGSGGVTRITRMFGVQIALNDHLLRGQLRTPVEALNKGLIDQLVATQEDLLPAAKAWIDENADSEIARLQPWDRPGYSVPGGTPSDPKFAQVLPTLPAKLRKQLKGAPLKAPRNILSASVEGTQVDFESASRIETRYFVDLLVTQQFKNMTQASFFDLATVKSRFSNADPQSYRKFTKLGVLGAGLMGAGIAFVAAQAGIEVILKDISLSAARQGKGYSKKILDKQVAQGRVSEHRANETLERIHPSDDSADLAGCDIVIEAVFESVELKHQVLQEVEPVVQYNALLSSNTSSLPITSLAEGVTRPEDFIGIHFFSPVDKMQLVEIVVGERTSHQSISQAIGFVHQIGKLPIVVGDSRGFFTSRVIGKFIDEGLELLVEGVAPSSIEQATTQAGFPTGVLQISDEIGIPLLQKVRDEARQAAETEGETWIPTSSEQVINRLLELERGGKLIGRGFYDYDDNGKRLGLWPGLTEEFPVTATEPLFEDLKDRLLFTMALETLMCLEEGVLQTVADANIGSIYGIGFPTLYGGALQFINGYEAADGRVGLEPFIERSQELAARYGERFDPPTTLLARAERGQKIE